MWVVTMFDLPVETSAQRRRYAKFRALLIEWGYDMLQKSVYVKYCREEDYCRTVRKTVERNAPGEGIVNTFAFTDPEFERQDFLRDGKRAAAPSKPGQVEFF